MLSAAEKRKKFTLLPAIVFTATLCLNPMPVLKSDAGFTHASRPPQRQPDGAIRFASAPSDFLPNLTPAEVLRLGSFGGGYFRRISSAVTGRVHEGEWKELPEEWLAGVDIATMVASDTYDPGVNQYRVRAGRTLGRGDPFGLKAWESSGWIVAQDPYGWFQVPPPRPAPAPPRRRAAAPP